MTTGQAIQDVAMIARNGIDRVIELERENKRLTQALLKADAQTEFFECEWYLRGDDIERLRKLPDEMFATTAGALSLVPQDCGAYNVLDDAIKNLQPRWIRNARGCVMSFDDFRDQVEAHLVQEKGWTEIQVADFISPRTRRLIQEYQDGNSVPAALATLLTTQPAQQHWD